VAVNYISTRGEAPALTFTDALITGLAQDGGLYLPQAYPSFSKETIAGFAGRPYADIAEAVLTPFVAGTIEPAALKAMLASAYARFDHAAVAPLAQLDDNLFLLELFRGPTLAFKDLAMQLLGRLMDHVLKARGQRAVIVGATSGDTGAAAIEAFRGLEQADVFILYPHQRVSDVQRRQMTTVDAPNIHVIALEGTFDDAQAIVKALFNHKSFREEFSLAGVNSINWARVAAQIVYYFTSAVALGTPFLHRADRQFRRYSCRLDRQADGPADRAARYRDERKRHSRAHADERPLRNAWCDADAIAVDGHSDLFEFRTAAV
jgi:threonine synthase